MLARLGCAWLLFGCQAVAQSEQVVPLLDRTGFDRCIEPLLVRNCSFTNCHGIEGMPLRVYSIGKLRAPGTPGTLVAQTALLTPAEHDGNFTSALALTYGRPAAQDNLLIRKPLPAESGGFEHKGGAIYNGPDDSCVTALSAWLQGSQPSCPQPGVCR